MTNEARAAELVTLITHETDEVVMLEHAMQYLDALERETVERCEMILLRMSDAESRKVEPLMGSYSNEAMRHANRHQALKEGAATLCALIQDRTSTGQDSPGGHDAASNEVSK